MPLEGGFPIFVITTVRLLIRMVKVTELISKVIKAV